MLFGLKVVKVERRRLWWAVEMPCSDDMAIFREESLPGENLRTSRERGTQGTESPGIDGTLNMFRWERGLAYLWLPVSRSSDELTV
jgi:hypothetical protein